MADSIDSLVGEGVDREYLVRHALLHSLSSAIEVQTEMLKLPGIHQVMFSGNVSAFGAVRHLIPRALSLMREEACWDLLNMNSVSFIDIGLQYLLAVGEQTPSAWDMSAEEAGHLYALHCLFGATEGMDTCEHIEQLIASAGKAQALNHFVNVLATRVPNRGVIARLLCGIVTPSNPRTDKRWIHATIIQQVLTAYARLLADPLSHPESNGWVLHCCLEIARNASLVELIAETLLKQVCLAEMSERIDTDLAGGYEDLLFSVCRGRARLASIRGGSIPPTQLIVDGDVEMDFDAIRESRDVRSAEVHVAYALLVEEFRRSPQGIVHCQCSPPKPMLLCAYSIADKRATELAAQLTKVEKLFALTKHADAFNCSVQAQNTLLQMGRISSVPGFAVYLSYVSKRANILHADCLDKRGNVEDAIAYYVKVFGSFSFEREMRLGKYEARAALSCMRLLQGLGRPSKADTIARAVVGSVLRSGVGVLADEQEFDIEAARAEARLFVVTN